MQVCDKCQRSSHIKVVKEELQPIKVLHLDLDSFFKMMLYFVHIIYIMKRRNRLVEINHVVLLSSTL